MGVDYYILCKEKKEFYSLGRNWFDFPGFEEHTGDRDAFIKAVIKQHDQSPSYSRMLGTSMYDWCEKRDWEVELNNDHSSSIPDFEEEDWKETGSYDQIAAVGKEQLLKYVVDAAEKLKRVTGADAVDVRIGIIEEEEDKFFSEDNWDNDDDDDDCNERDNRAKCWEYYAEDKPTIKVSGYRRITVYKS